MGNYRKNNEDLLGYNVLIDLLMLRKPFYDSASTIVACYFLFFNS